jgi:hypothetical protein
MKFASLDDNNPFLVSVDSCHELSIVLLASFVRERNAISGFAKIAAGDVV